MPINAFILSRGYNDIINAKLIPDSIMVKIKEAFHSDNSDQPGLLRMLSSSRKIKKAVFVLAGSIPILICVLLLGCKLFWHRVPRLIKKQVYSIKYMIFFNAPIRTLMEMFYPLMCQSLVTLLNPRDYPDSTVFSSIVLVSVLTGLCIFVLNFLTKNHNLVEDRDYQKRFGAFYTNIEIYNKPMAAYYSFIFLAHRLLMAITITCMGKLLVLQVFLMTHFNLALLSWLLTVKPMDTQYKNLLEIINANLVLFIGYFSFCFSDYVTDPIAKYQIGYFYIAVIIGFFVFNLAFQAVFAIKEYYVYKQKKIQVLAMHEEERKRQGVIDPKRLTFKE